MSLFLPLAMFFSNIKYNIKEPLIALVFGYSPDEKVSGFIMCIFLTDEDFFFMRQPHLLLNGM